jgi:CobQ-like glutamine amidotransferase family enzyme
MRLIVGYLYPSVMSQYGDRGNVLTVIRRCAWRGISAEVTGLDVGDRVDPDRVDLLLIGGGADSHQRLVCEDLLRVKGEGIRRAIDEGAAAFAVCAGYQLWGHYYKTATGEELRGLGVFDAHTVHRAAQTGTRLDTITRAGSVRAVGNLVVQWGTTVLVGFENHGGRTYLHSGAQPLGRVQAGGGNNSEDGLEGCVHGNAIGTYLHGPALPKNPALADHLIAAALRRRYGDVTLPPLDDDPELTAHEQALGRALARPGRWRLPWGEGVALPRGRAPSCQGHAAASVVVFCRKSCLLADRGGIRGCLASAKTGVSWAWSVMPGRRRPPGGRDTRAGPGTFCFPVGTARLAR